MTAFTVYGRPGCGYCVAAQRLLEGRGYTFNYVDMYAEGLSKADVERTVGRPVHTVPQVLHGDHYIGGYSELVPYIKQLESAA
jgi:glutaredoxin 1